MHRKIQLVHLEMVKEKELHYRSCSTPDIAAELAGGLIPRADREYLFVICADAKYTPVSIEIVSKGTACSCIAETREIFKTAIISNAANILLVHNHLSGDPSPSTEDLMLTRDIIRAGKIIGIPIVDHIIIADGKVFSFKEKGMKFM